MAIEGEKQNTFSTKQAVDSLRSNVCPACNKKKKPHQSLCYPCYRRLPTDRKHDLYLDLGGGYEEAVGDAINLLGTTVPYMPEVSP